MLGYQWMPIHSEGCHLIYFIAPSVIITQFPAPFFCRRTQKTFSVGKKWRLALFEVLLLIIVDYTISWMALCFALAVYNHVKKIIIIMCECTSVLGQKTSAAHRRVECFIVFWLSCKYKPDLKFVHVSFILIKKRFF